MADSIKEPPGCGGFLPGWFRGGVLGISIFTPEELIAHQRDDRQRQEKRNEDGDGKRDRQGGKELPYDSFQQAER